MKGNPKTRRRLVIFLVGMVVLAGAAGGAYGLRRYQVRRRANLARIDGVAAYAAGDYAQVLQKMGTYLSVFPNDVEALSQYARAREEVVDGDGKHLRQAIALYRRIVDLEPDRMEARQRLLGLYSQQHYLPETVDAADAILLRKSNDPAALCEKAKALTALRRFAEALPLSQRCNELNPLDVQMQILTLSLMRETKQAPEAIVLRADLLRKAHADDARFELLQSVACGLADDRTKAVEWAKAAAARNLQDAELINALVGQLDSLGLYAESLQVLEAAASDKVPLLQVALISRLIQMKRTSEVADRLAQLDLNSASSDGQLLALRALALIQLDRAAEAAPIIVALNLRNSDIRLRTWVGMLRALSQQDKLSARELLQACRDGLAIAPANPYYRFYAAQAYTRLGETELALEQYRLAAVNARVWADPIVRMANTLAVLGRLQEAFDISREARRRAPKDPQVLTSMAAVLTSAMLGNPADTQVVTELGKIITEIQEVAPQDEHLLLMQVAVAARPEHDKALALLQSALQSRSDLSEPTLLSLARLSQLFKFGQEQACFDCSEKLHGLTPDLVFARAQVCLAAGKPRDGVALFDAADKAAADQRKGDEMSWSLARARYLEIIEDPSAKPHWAALGEKYPDNTSVQRSVLAAKSTQSDRELIARTIEHLRAQVGDQGLFWRFAKAGWLLGGAGGEKELAEAIMLLGDVTRGAPEWVAPRLLLASCLEKTGNFSGAVEQLQSASAAAPNSLDILLDLARLHQLRGDFEQAKQALERVVANPQLTAAQRRRAATIFTQQGAADRALALMEKSQGDEPQSPDLLMAALYAQRNQLDKAQQIVVKLLEQPDPAVIRFAAELYLSMGKSDEAQSVLAKLDTIQARPGVKDQVLADYAQRSGDADGALKHLQAAVKADATNASAWQRLVSHLLAMGRGGEAISAADEALKAQPANTSFEAFRHQRKFIEAAASDAALRALLLAMLAQAEDVTAAVESLQALGLPKDRAVLGEAVLLRLRQVADRYPRFLAVQNVLAQMYGAAGKYDDAVTIATRAMQTSPTAAEPAAIAAGALGSLGRWSQVLGVAEQWRQRTLANPIAADVIIATADLMLRDPAKAQQQLEIYLERAKAAPDRYGPVLVSYAQALCAQRKFTAAADLLGPLLATSPQLRLAWIQLASEAVAQVEIPTAAQWLDSFSQRITSPTIDEQAVLAQAWWRLSQRSKDPLHAQKARQVLDSATSAALASDKPPTQALLILAMTHEAGGDVAAAEQIYRRVLTIDPAMMVAQNNLAVLIMDRGGNLNEALDLARKASSVNHSGHASALETLASIQAKLKDYAHAVENLDAALRVSPEKMDWRIERVQFLADGGQSAKARSALDEVERLRPDPASLSPSSRDMLQSLRQQFGLAVGNPPTTRPALSDVHQ